MSFARHYVAVKFSLNFLLFPTQRSLELARRDLCVADLSNFRFGHSFLSLQFFVYSTSKNTKTFTKMPNFSNFCMKNRQLEHLQLAGENSRVIYCKMSPEKVNNLGIYLWIQTGRWKSSPFPANYYSVQKQDRCMFNNLCPSY